MSFCRPHWIHIPPISRSFGYVRPCRFSPKVFHPKLQSDSLRILISLCIPDNITYSLISLSVTPCIPSLVSQGAYYLWLLLRTRRRINMVQTLVHQVKFKLEQTRSRASLLGGCIILIPERFTFISSLPKSVPHNRQSDSLHILISLFISVPALYLCIPSLLSKGCITQGFC